MKTMESVHTEYPDHRTLISKRELSKELHKSCRTIENWVKAGYISCIKVRHSVFFDRKQVFADLRGFQIGGRAAD